MIKIGLIFIFKQGQEDPKILLIRIQKTQYLCSLSIISRLILGTPTTKRLLFINIISRKSKRNTKAYSRKKEIIEKRDKDRKVLSIHINTNYYRPGLNTH